MVPRDSTTTAVMKDPPHIVRGPESFLRDSMAWLQEIQIDTENGRAMEVL